MIRIRLVVAGITTAGLFGVRAIRAQETPSDTLLTVQHYRDWEQAGDPQPPVCGSAR